MSLTKRRPQREFPYEPRGAAVAALTDRSPELLVAGPAGTGKSVGLLNKLYFLADRYPGMRGLIVRQVRASLTETGLVSWEKLVCPPGSPVLSGPSRGQRVSYNFPNGSQINVGGLDRPDKIMSSEYDMIFCLSGDTVVRSETPIERGYRRPYRGPLVTIKTAGGNELTGTPNHPVLTDYGWIALGELNVGNNVVCRPLAHVSPACADPNVDDGPTTLADVFGAMALANPRGTERVVTVPMDFHGDGCDGYVDVVTAAGQFHRGREAASREPFVERDGGRGYFQPPLLVRGGSAVTVRGGMDAPGVPFARTTSEGAHPFSVDFGCDPLLTGHFGRGGEIPFPFGSGVPNVAHRLSLALGSWDEAASGHLGFQSRNTDSDGLGDGHQAPASCEVVLDSIVHLSVCESPAGWHVYNLQTRDNCYFANNILTHNCQEATEVKEEGWEALTTRLRNGVMPYQQLMADCNPSAPSHWLKKRCDAGRCKLINSRHEDNPRLHDGRDWTEFGRVYLAKLDNLTGARKLRLRYGRWAQAEGVVYENWNSQVHVIDAFPIPADWTRYLVIDFGFTNPCVVHFWATDPDGRLYLYREIYRTRTLIEDIAKEVRALIEDDTALARSRLPSSLTEQDRARAAAAISLKPKLVICDHDAEDRRTFERHAGLPTVAAHKAVTMGIQTVGERLQVRPDGRPRLMVFRGARYHAPDSHLLDDKRPTCTEEEFDGYVWSDSRVKEQPVKEDDHGCDCARYMAVHLSRNPKLASLVF